MFPSPSGLYTSLTEYTERCKQILSEKFPSPSGLYTSLTMLLHNFANRVAHRFPSPSGLYTSLTFPCRRCHVCSISVSVPFGAFTFFNNKKGYITKFVATFPSPSGLFISLTYYEYAVYTLCLVSVPFGAFHFFNKCHLE